MKLRLLFALVVLVGIAQPAHATLVSGSYSGTGSIFDPNNFIGGSAFDVPFSGSFAYDSDAALFVGPTPTGPPDFGNIAEYNMSPPLGSRHLSLSIGGLHFESDANKDLLILIQDLLPSNPGNKTDSIGLLSGFPVSPDVAIAPMPFNIFGISFLDSTGNVFSDTSIPTSLDRANFGSASLTLQVRDPSDINTVLWQISGSITEASTVPEPSTWLLFGSGLAGLAAWRRKQKRA